MYDILTDIEDIISKVLDSIENKKCHNEDIHQDILQQTFDIFNKFEDLCPRRYTPKIFTDQELTKLTNDAKLVCHQILGNKRLPQYLQSNEDTVIYVLNRVKEYRKNQKPNNDIKSDVEGFFERMKSAFKKYRLEENLNKKSHRIILQLARDALDVLE